MAQIATALLREGEPMPGASPSDHVTVLDNTAVNHAGGYAVTATTFDGFQSLSRIWGNPTGGAGTVLRTEMMIGNLVQTAFEAFFGLDDAGRPAYSAAGTGGPVGNFDSVWLDDTPIAVQGDPVPSLPGQYYTFASRPGVTRDGQPYWQSGLTNAPGGAVQNRALLFGNNATVKLLGGSSVPGLPFSLVTSAMSFDYRFSELGTHFITPVTMISGSTSNDEAMVLDGNGLLVGAALVREQSPVPVVGGGLPGETWDNFDYCGVNEAGDWFFTGDTEPATTTDEIVVKNGVVIHREGDAIGSEVLAGSIEGAYMNANGDLAILWDVRGDTLEALILNDRLVLKETDLVDLSGDGVLDANARLANFTSINAVTVTDRDPQGRVTIYFVADIDTTGTPTAADDIEALFSILVPTVTNEECKLSHVWRRGPPITVTEPLNHWPDAQQLLEMRPGDAIGIATMARDYDYLQQSCTDCYDQTVTRKWGPYADRVQYSWGLTPESAGTLVTAANPTANAVVYQIPRCWLFDSQTQTATVTLEIANGGDGVKEFDVPITGASITFTMQACGTPGFVRVLVDIVHGAPQMEEPVAEGGSGSCVPAPPVWMPGTPLVTSPIAVTEPLHLCPDYLALLSVTPSDSDELQLSCESSDPNCEPPMTSLTVADAFDYFFLINPGSGSLPLGGFKGPAVVFNRSRSDSARVTAYVRDSQSQFVDPWWVLSERTMLKAKRPKAFVGIGDATVGLLGVRSLDLENAAEKARQKFESAGYEVEFNPTASKANALSAMRVSCYQAFWFTGHGTSGGIRATGPAASNLILFDDLENAASMEWGCMRHPFLREVTLLGCNTYSQYWPLKLVCGTVNSFNHKLWSDVFGLSLTRFFATNPYIWERDVHTPLPPHDLTFP